MPQMDYCRFDNAMCVLNEISKFNYIVDGGLAKPHCRNTKLKNTPNTHPVRSYHPPSNIISVPSSDAYSFTASAT